MSKTILVASSNKHKQKKLTEIVKDFFDVVDYPKNLNLDIDEAGSTFLANASIKAIEYSKNYPGYVICTDGGVLIPALKDKWDPLRTKRFAGENISDFDRIAILLEMMKDKEDEDRKMVWQEALAIGYQGKIVFKTQARGVDGYLQKDFNPEHYREGIWVCSVWFFPQFNKNFFELIDKEIDEVEISWERLKTDVHEFLKLL